MKASALRMDATRMDLNIESDPDSHCGGSYYHTYLGNIVSYLPYQPRGTV